MENRYSFHPEHVRGMDTDELRRHFAVTDLFVDGEIRLVHSHHERVILGGVVPAGGELVLPVPVELRAAYFCQRRELGIVCVAGEGTVVADGTRHDLRTFSILYLGRGTREVTFGGDARFYLFSAPAHAACDSALVHAEDATVRELGDQLTSNRRTIRQYIHEDGVRSCQIVMGITTLHPGSMWNTMPAHTHDRRMEAYLYLDVPADARVVHFMGEPTQTRHLVLGNEDAVISPSWSIHSGVGSSAYSFVWAMAGENQSFDDMDHQPITTLR